MAGKSITGRVRRRTTGNRVKTIDSLARLLITTAGIGTILAVTAVCVFLAWVVVPLFLPGKITASEKLATVTSQDDGDPIFVTVDEYEVLGLAYFASGRVKVFHLDDASVLESRQLFENKTPSSHAFQISNGHVIFGFTDGSIQYGTIGFDTRYINYADLEPEYRKVQVGEARDYQGGVLQRTPTGQFRVQQLGVTLDPPLKLTGDSPVVLVDLSMQSSGPVFCSFTEDGTFHINAVRRTRNLMTRKETLSLTGGRMAVEMPEGKGLPKYLKLEGRADTALLAWEDGYAIRIDTRNRNEPILAETLDLIPEPGVTITSMQFMIGKMTLIVGDSKGRLNTWFRVKPEGVAQTLDERLVVKRENLDPHVAARLVSPDPEKLPATLRTLAGDLLVITAVDASLLINSQELPGQPMGVPVTSLAASKRTRMLAAGYANGQARLYYVTSSQLLSEVNVLDTNDPVTLLAMSPKDNGLIAGSVSGLSRWNLDFPHPQTTFASIFTKVWYEGFEKPEYIWQSSSGTDEFEPKFGLIPLIFGTLKATFYTMLFGTPIALLAAIYTSEFLHPRVKAAVKPSIEVMASLPSVVLGFLAALVFAPVVEKVVPGVLASFFFVPLTFLIGAFLWQLLPSNLSIKFNQYRFFLMVFTLPLGVLIALWFGPLVEKLFFGGDLKGWLAWKYDPTKPDANVQFRSAVGGWIMLMIPLSVLVVSFIMGGIINPMLRTRFRSIQRLQLGLLNIVKFFIGGMIAIALAWALSAILSMLGFDPRGSFVDTYVQRNALIVGFVMGFAVIPIIYTLAEDALSSVPEYLRAGSLGAGATQWQTATRIIIPTAMSGLFSACMIGLGRAVGETMIVLMAAGNTPVLQWNIFNGFRTLSANIAVELPEAVQNGTEYRMLFLSAFTLFIMTFVLNTVAETIRQRFRKRAFAL